MAGWSTNAAFAFFDGVPQLLVPDNAKIAVIKACHFDPMVNPALGKTSAICPATPCDSGKYGSIRRICASDNQIGSRMATLPHAANDSAKHPLRSRLNGS